MYKVVDPEEAKTLVCYPAKEESMDGIRNIPKSPDYEFLQVDCPVPVSVMKDIAGAIPFNIIWSSLDQDIRIVCEEIQKFQESEASSLMQTDERCIVARILIPIPKRIVVDTRYNLAEEIIPEIKKALVMNIRYQQVHCDGTHCG